MSAQPVQVRPGDIVRRPKGPVTHVGVVVDGGLVLHNTPERGEHLATLAEFTRGRPLRIERPATSERLRILASAGIRPGSRRYHLLRNNCEHTVYRARDGRSRSPQLRAWALGAVGALAGTLLLRHWGATVAGWELGRRFGSRQD